MCTTTDCASGGVAVFGKPEHKILEGSIRESLNGGHYVMAIFEIALNNVLLCGVYGNPDHNDRRSESIFINMLEDIQELKNLFPVHNIILAGDFNCILKEMDSHTRKISKPRTHRILLQIIEEFQLNDIAEMVGQDGKHTYHRAKDQKISSRIDYILSNIVASKLYYETHPTIFDHHYVSATILHAQESQSPKIISMKEYVLASTEFIHQFNNEINDFCINSNIPIRSENITRHERYHSDINDENRQQIDSQPNNNDNRMTNESDSNDRSTKLPTNDDIRELNNTLHDKNVTALELFSTIIRLTQKLHDDIFLAQQRRQRTKVKQRRLRMHAILKNLKGNIDEDRKKSLVEEYENIQEEIRYENEAKDTAKRMSIKNFYDNKTGKNVPLTFYSTKEKKAKRGIDKIRLADGSDTTDKDEIINVMQDWYQNIANTPHEQTLHLEEFLRKYDVTLPKISKEQSDDLSEEITSEEILESIMAAKEYSASGPSGQSISMYKLLFKELPTLFTAAINQIVFVPGMATQPEMQWIKERKIVYIPKKTALTSPSDYRPLSMLEVLYKIPARIIARRLNSIVSSIIGPHQHGFMPTKGIQEPTLVMAHVVQEAAESGQPVQILSYDIENAFSKVSHTIITQSLRSFGIPEILISALEQYTLIGYAKVEVNGKTGVIFIIKTGSGQGDPLSAVLYLIATEPCNRALIKHCENILYKSTLNFKIGIKLYADDNKTPLQLTRPSDIQIIHSIYSDYTQTSGLKINFKKSSALCLNTSEEILQGIADTGIPIVNQTDCLGVILSTSMEETINKTMQKIEPKAITKRILATSHPSNMLHKSILLNIAVQPIYNHVFMALPVLNESVDKLFSEIFKFLWTKQHEQISIVKRRLVSKQRIFADFSMGGLGIHNPKEKIMGLQQNLLQKLLKNPEREMSTILERILQKIKRPNLEQHLQLFGFKQWEKTAAKLVTENLILSQAFSAMAQYVLKFENGPQWEHNAIYGHNKAAGLMEITYSNFRVLFEAGLTTISQIVEIDQTTSRIQFPVKLNDRVQTILRPHPMIIFKLKKFLTLFPNTLNICLPSPNTNIFIIISKSKNISQNYRKACGIDLVKSIKIAPAYNTRIRDRVDLVSKELYIKAYNVIRHKFLPLKTKENSFQILNRTLWSNNKAFKAGISNTPACRFCGQTETMEHMIYKCENYAELQWELLAETITFLARKTNDEMPRLHVTVQNIIYNTEIQSISRYIKDTETRIMIAMTIHELRRKIYAFRTSTDDVLDGEIPLIRRVAHIMTVFKSLKSYLSYISTIKWSTAIESITIMEEYLHEKLSIPT